MLIKTKQITFIFIVSSGNWGEFNVIEQRWRKAWVEKFGSSDKK